MSLSWRDRVHFALCPDRVVMARFARGPGREVTAKQCFACAPREPDAGAPAWRRAADTLVDAVRSVGDGGSASATVILSNHFVRYLLVPWSDELDTEQEIHDFARACFTQTYGDAAATWDLRLGSGGDGAPWVASAADVALINAVTQAFDGSALQLRSVQPYLMAAFNQYRRRLGGAAAWFALAERGRVCLARFQDERWHGLRAMTVGERLDAELPTLLERERYLGPLDAAEARVFLFSPEEPAPAQDAGAAADAAGFERLELAGCPGFSPDEDRDYAIAMTG